MSRLLELATEYSEFLSLNVGLALITSAAKSYWSWLVCPGWLIGLMAIGGLVLVVAPFITRKLLLTHLSGQGYIVDEQAYKFWFYGLRL